MSRNRGSTSAENCRHAVVPDDVNDCHCGGEKSLLSETIVYGSLIDVDDQVHDTQE